MDFHAIRYDVATSELMRICYYQRTKVYQEPLNKEIIIKIDRWHKQYIITKTITGDEITLHIREGDIAAKTIAKSTNVQDKSNATSTYKTFNNQNILHNHSIRQRTEQLT